MMPSEIFSAFAEEAGALLIAQGFQCTRKELGGVFGSHLVQFDSSNNSVALLWDGKEEWLIARSEKTNEELFFRKLSASSTTEDYQSATQAALATLQHYFSAPHDHDEDGHCCGHHHA